MDTYSFPFLQMALSSWLRLPVLAWALTLVSALPHSFENTAIVRTVDLGGSLVYVTTTYAIRALDDGAKQYVVSLGEKEAQSVSWFEAKFKGQSEPLGVTTGTLDPHELGLNVLRHHNRY
jgi:oligosaccharyltransferase complex subunit alpha (ribophorin I)